MPTEETATAIDISSPQRKQAPVIVKTKTLLPKPKQLSFKPKDAIKFFEWWKSFKPDQAARADLKVYRKYPVIDLKLVGSKYKDRIDELAGEIPFDPQEYEAHFLHSYGSGKYNLIMNEKGVPGMVSAVMFTVEESESYPPRIDMGSLVRGHPDNRGFEEGWRSRGGKFPGEQAEGEEQSDMTVVGQLADTLIRTNERLMDKADEQQQNSGPDPITEATSQAIGVIAEGAKAAIQMTRDNASDISRASAPNFNPMDMMTKAFELAKAGNGDNGLGMLTLVLEMQRQSQTQMQQTYKDMIDAMRESQAPAIPQKSDLDTLMEKATQFKGLMDMFTGGRRESSGPMLPPAGKGILQTIAENPEVMQAFSGVASSVAQIVMAWLSRPQPGAINPAPQATPDQLLHSNGIGPQPVQKPPTPEELQRQAALEQQAQFLKMIEKPLIAHFFDTERRGLSGYTFAHSMQEEFKPQGVVTPQGRLMYETVLQWPNGAFQKLCEGYGDIYNVCGGNKVKWIQFFTEFFNYDQWYQEQERLQAVAGTPN